MPTRRTKLFEVFWFDLDIRDFKTEVIETTSLKAAQQYGREVERDSDHLKFRWAQAAKIGKSKARLCFQHEKENASAYKTSERIRR